MTRRSFWLILVVLGAIRLALMATVPVFEPSEARYAAIAANMARTGDFIVPRFTYKLTYRPFDGKPPLVFQAGGLCCKAFGVCEFAVRLFPFLCAALLLLILYRAVARRSDAATARLSVAICATSVSFFAASGIAMTDMTLTVCVAGALFAYWRFADDGGFACAAGTATLLGLGVLAKGPVALALFGVPVLADAAVNRRWNAVFDRKWLFVAPLFLAIVIPWFVLAEQRNPGSLRYFLLNENLLRFVSHDYGDRFGTAREFFPGVSIVWAFVATLPWALLPLWDIFRRFRKSNNQTIKQSNNFPWKSFGFLSLAAITGFWCLTSRALVYYLLPVVPLFAAGLALEGDRERLRRFALPCAVLAVLVTAGAFAGGMLFTDKMRGAKTEFGVVENRYACEFYHGTKDEAELRRYREAVAAWLREHPRKEEDAER